MISDDILRELAVRRRLGFIRYLYSSAERQCQLPEPMSVAGLLGLHDSIELFLVLACDVTGAGKKDMKFLEYFNAIQQKTGVELTQRLALARLNEARVALKHHGIFPSRTDLLDFRVVTGLFFTDNCPPLFRISFDKASFADFVVYPEAREKFAASEEFLANGQLKQALETIAVGFHLGIWRFERESNGRERLSRGFGSISRRDLDRKVDGLGSTLEDLEKKLLSLEYNARLEKAGIDVRAFETFQSYTPGVAVAGSGVYSTYSRPNAPDPDADIVRFCLDFAVTSCVRFQAIRPPAESIDESGPSAGDGAQQLTV